MLSIYQPAEDSYLLKECLISFLSGKSKSINILDMGSGSGIQARTCKGGKWRTLDICKKCWKKGTWHECKDSEHTYEKLSLKKV